MRKSTDLCDRSSSTAKNRCRDIYATRALNCLNATHHTVELFTYQHLIELAKNVAPQLADFDTIFQPVVMCGTDVVQPGRL